MINLSAAQATTNITPKTAVWVIPPRNTTLPVPAISSHLLHNRRTPPLTGTNQVNFLTRKVHLPDHGMTVYFPLTPMMEPHLGYKPTTWT